MKTIILHGGGITDAPDMGRSFYRAILPGHVQSKNIAMCYFASYEYTQEVDDYTDLFLVANAKYHERALRFYSNNHYANINTVILTVNNFIEEVKKADIVWFHGGNTDNLKKLLLRAVGKNLLVDLLDNKIVVAESAGANAISHTYYSLVHCKVLAGFRVFPHHVIVHYLSDYNPKLKWDEAELLMKNSAESRKQMLVPLCEGQFQKFIL